MKLTGDTDVVYGVATGRDAEGNLQGFQIGMPYEQAKHYYDNFQAHALLQIDVTVLSSIDGALDPS